MDVVELKRLAIAAERVWHSIPQLRAAGFGQHDAEFIAACSPDTILALISGLQASRT